MLCSIRQRGWANSAVTQRGGEHDRGVRRPIGREPANQVLQVLHRGDHGGQRHAIITGYHAAVNPAKLGLGLTAIIRFKASHAPDERIFPVIMGCPEIVEFHSVTGDDCMTLTAVVSSVEHLQDLISRLTPYGSSHTSIVLSSPLRHRAIGPAALAHEAEHERSA